MDHLSEKFYINKFYLTRVFKEQFGQSVTAYLVQLRITQAKRMLRFTDHNMEAIAQDCGLSDANYFARLFKKVEGISPANTVVSGKDGSIFHRIRTTLFLTGSAIHGMVVPIKHRVDFYSVMLLFATQWFPMSHCVAFLRF